MPQKKFLHYRLVLTGTIALIIINNNNNNENDKSCTDNDNCKKTAILG